MPNHDIRAYFRHSLIAARRPRPGYRAAGYQLALHMEAHAEDVGVAKLDALLSGDDFVTGDEIWAWLVEELPGCARAVPARRRGSFLAGVIDAIEEGRV